MVLICASTELRFLPDRTQYLSTIKTNGLMLFKDINWYLMCQSHDVKKRRVASRRGTHCYHWISNRARRIVCNVNLICYFVIYKVPPIQLGFLYM